MPDRERLQIGSVRQENTGVFSAERMAGIRSHAEAKRFVARTSLVEVGDRKHQMVDRPRL